MNCNCFRHSIKTEYQETINLLDTISDNVPRFNTKKWIEVYDQPEGIYNTKKKNKI